MLNQFNLWPINRVDVRLEVRNSFGEVFYLLFLGVITFFIFLLAFFLRMRRRFLHYAKKLPFECGFDKINKVRMTFCVQFYHIGLLFLLFDLEVILISLLVFNYKSKVLCFSWLQFFYVCVFLVVLLLGVMHEYREGSLEWKD